jgi:hypothetical protein
MPQTSGTFDGGTPKMVSGYGDNKERQIGSDYVLQVKDPIFADNYEFWQAVENVEDWNIAWRTETQLAVVDSDVTITTKAPAEEGLDTDVVWNIEAKWFSKNKPELIAYPAGLFDSLDENLERITGLSIAQGDAMYFEVDADKSCRVILSDGSVIYSTDGLIDENASVGGDIIILVSKDTELMYLSCTSLEGNMNFVVGSKTEINLSDCNFTTDQCDYILDQLIANGTVTGTHTIDFTGNAEMPTPSKVAEVEALGWTVVVDTIQVGDLYGGGRVVFVDGTQILIACTTVNGDLIEITESSDYATTTTDFVTAFNNTIQNGYDDWRLPTLTEGLLLIENTVEQIITDGTLNEVAAYAALWWTSTIPATDYHDCLNWEGSNATIDSQEDINIHNAFAIRKVTL